MGSIVFENHTVDAGSSMSGNDVRGKLAFVQYTRPSSGAYDSGATASVKISRAGVHDISVLTSLNLDSDGAWYPRTPVHDTAGSPISGFADRYVLVDARIEVAVTGGGSGTGNFLIVFER